MSSLIRIGGAVLLLGCLAVASPLYGQAKKPPTPGEMLKDSDPSAEPKKFLPATPEEAEASNARARAKAALVAEKMGIALETLETPHFIIFTDWDKREHKFLTTNLELAYGAVSKQFNLPKTDNIFVGKLPVYMFAKQGDFRKHTQEFDKFEATETLLGYYMGNSLGYGHMSMWKPDVKKAGGNVKKAELDWAYTLVHEFTHAFIARYRTNTFIPRWLNEGLAEVIASGQFPKPEVYPYVKRRVKEIDVIRLMNEKAMFKGEDYPVAQTLVETLIKGDRKAFLVFFNDIKDGMSVEDALKKGYKTDPKGLEQAWKKYVEGFKG